MESHNFAHCSFQVMDHLENVRVGSHNFAHCSFQVMDHLENVRVGSHNFAHCSFQVMDHLENVKKYFLCMSFSVLYLHLNHYNLWPSFQVMDHLENVKEMDFLSMSFSVLNGYVKTMSRRQKEQLLGIILRCIVNSVENPNWGAFNSYRGISFETLCEIGEELKAEFPKLILHAWKELCSYFRSNHLQGIIGIIKNSVSQNASLTSELSKMVIGYFQGKFMHGEDCIELLSILESKPTVRQEAINCITMNSKNYTVKALLHLAKKEHERYGLSKVSGEVFNKKVFQVLLPALAIMKTDVISAYIGYADSAAKSEQRTYLKFFYQEYEMNGTAEVAKGAQFLKFTEALVENCDVEALLSFCEVMQTCKPLFDKVVELVGTNLGQKYSLQFDMRLKRCNHSEYNKILSEMMTARKHFTQYVPNGEEEFRTMLNNIRRDHKNKKKLQKLIIEYFLPQLHKDIA